MNAFMLLSVDTDITKSRLPLVILASLLNRVNAVSDLNALITKQLEFFFFLLTTYSFRL